MTPHFRFHRGNRTHWIMHRALILLGSDTKNTRRMIFTMLHFDDWWGDYQARYIAQIDAHLLQHRVDGAELVFCLRHNLFFGFFTALSTAT